ncbi:NXPE family member 4-like [Acanthaster planci]|uniref:NXPE family member 4-like n=1 Tax=Acanthaster planci TaxID=133434 RepID=A0A8B7YIF8_ACAPL|nr:NXPE family member 4-like [Acanthaster planci]
MKVSYCIRPCPGRFGWPLLFLVLSVFLSVVLYVKISPMQQLSPIPRITSFHSKTRPSLLTGSGALTSALKSTYRLVGETLHVGDTAHFVIQAKDSNGRNKTSGGDFWFTVLTSEAGEYPTTGGRTAGSVVDHNNGSYSVYFYVGWQGTAFVHITLAAPSEATKWLREKYWPVERRVFWKAEFWGRHSIETALCFVHRNLTSTSNLCVVDHNPRAMGSTAFYCQKPRVAKCEDFKTVAVDPNMVNNRTRELLQNDTALFDGKNYLQPLTRGPPKITIGTQSNATIITQAPICNPDEEPPLNHGFWLDADWYHLQCKVQKWDNVKAVRECLRQKHVFIHGDSNVRSWYSLLAKKMGYPWKHLGTGADKMVIHHYYQDSKIETSFYFHPRVVTNSKVYLDTTPYEVDILDNIRSNQCNEYIIVLCPWGHFTQWTRESFAERMNLLKEAVLRLRERCPDVPVVLKGTHTREHENVLKAVYASDYTLWAWGRILRDTFRGTGVFFYDVWQMSLAYGKPDIHMPLEVINEEVNWFLSYVCR